METRINKQKDSKIKHLIDLIISDVAIERKKAREELVKLGSDVIDYLKKYVNHPKHMLRWEALKTMEEIAHPESIPFFIEALEDDEYDIRWIAAEGLINIGSESIIPILRAIIEKSDSIFFLEGTHHVIYDLKKSDCLPHNFPADKILTTIKKYKSGDAIKLLAYKTLIELEN